MGVLPKESDPKFIVDILWQTEPMLAAANGNAKHYSQSQEWSTSCRYNTNRWGKRKRRPATELLTVIYPIVPKKKRTKHGESRVVSIDNALDGGAFPCLFQTFQEIVHPTVQGIELQRTDLTKKQDLRTPPHVLDRDVAEPELEDGIFKSGQSAQSDLQWLVQVLDEELYAAKDPEQSRKSRRAKRLRWTNAELRSLWQGIAVYGNDWVSVSNVCIQKSYTQVKDKARRFLISQGWTTGRKKEQIETASARAKEIARRVVEAM